MLHLLSYPCWLILWGRRKITSRFIGTGCLQNHEGSLIINDLLTDFSQSLLAITPGLKPFNLTVLQGDPGTHQNSKDWGYLLWKHFPEWQSVWILTNSRSKSAAGVPWARQQYTPYHSKAVAMQTSWEAPNHYPISSDLVPRATSKPSSQSCFVSKRPEQKSRDQPNN